MRLVCVCAALAASILLAGPAGTAPGGRDSASSARGTVLNVGQGGLDYGLAAAIQRDGKIVVAGESNGVCPEGSCISWSGFALTRYLPNGSLDRSFGRAGKVLTEVPGESDDGAFAIVVRADGRIVVAGGGGWGSGVTLIRYTRSGRLDPRFGKGGIAQPALRDECGAFARALAIQADGKIVVAGECLAKNSEDWQDGLLARYTPNGRLDRTFGDGGSVLTGFGSVYTSARAVAIQADGRIVVAGESYRAVVGNEGFALARYMPDGRMDPSFGSGGKVLEVPAAASALALQPDGKIVAAGAGVARYAADGSPDRGFGSGGKVPTDFGVSGVAIQGDGKIVVAGSIERGQYFAVRRYLSDGAPDAGFGSGGRAVTDIRAGSGDTAREVALQRDGMIVVAGSSSPSILASDFALARYTTGGRLDGRFGKGGKVLTSFGAGVTGLASFSATRRKQGVLVRWRTTAEEGIRGFHIYRQPEGKSPVRANRRLIVSKGSATRGASYSLRDRRARKAARYVYQLREVRRDGRTIDRGQAAVKR